MNGLSTVRTAGGGLSSPGHHDSSRAVPLPRAPRRRRSMPHTFGPRAPGRSGAVARAVAGMLLVIAAAGPHATPADDSKCVGQIVKLEPGRIRLRAADGTSTRVDSAKLPDRICVLEVVEGLPRYRVSITEGEWEGAWFIKRRNVVRIEGLSKPECPPPEIVAIVEIRGEREGGMRAIGEEPCD